MHEWSNVDIGVAVSCRSGGRFRIPMNMISYRISNSHTSILATLNGWDNTFWGHHKRMSSSNLTHLPFHVTAIFFFSHFAVGWASYLGVVPPSVDYLKYSYRALSIRKILLPRGLSPTGIDHRWYSIPNIVRGQGVSPELY